MKKSVEKTSSRCSSKDLLPPCRSKGGSYRSTATAKCDSLAGLAFHEQPGPPASFTHPRRRKEEKKRKRKKGGEEVYIGLTGDPRSLRPPLLDPPAVSPKCRSGMSRRISSRMTLVDPQGKMANRILHALRFSRMIQCYCIMGRGGWMTW